MKKTLMLAAILTVGTSMIAMAEENIASQRLNETVISTENFETSVLDTAKNVTIVTQEDIQNKGANTVAEALRGVPGLVVSKMDGSGDAVFDLRGSGATGAQNTIVLLDGIPLNNVQGSGYDTSQIPVDQIEKIEIIPSGGAVMYGDGAIGGIINIVTKAPENRSNYGNMGLETGSWGTLKGTLTYGTKVTDRLLMDVSYSNYRSAGFRDKTKGAPHDQYDKDDTKESVWLRGRYLLDDGYLEAKYRHSKTEDYYTSYITKEQFKEDVTMAGTYNGVSEMEQDNYSLSYNKKVNDKLSLMIYGGYDEREYKGAYFGSISSHSLAKQYYIKPQIKYLYGENSYIIVGGDYKDGKSEDKLDSSSKDKTRESYAGYILNKTTIRDFQFTQGYRREKIKYDTEILTPKPGPGYGKDTIGNKKTFNADSYELAANYLYSDTGSVYISYTHAFRGPTINDLNSWYGNIDLQETKSYELGIKDSYKNTYISTSIFMTDTDNEIYLDKIQRGGKYDNKNFDGEVRRIGVELALQHYFNKLTLRENVTYIQPKVTSGEYDGKEFAGVSRWNINLGATYNFTEKLLGNIDMYYQSKAYAQDDFANKLGKVNDYVTVDTNLRYKLDNGLEVYGGIRNLFDEEYSGSMVCDGTFTFHAYRPADGRSFYAGFKYNF
ncbi:TonB-dependent receptor [uncultured Fusobacterium sp.]|uniref:TonB-dependent receptor n=1 Tax=uncultured Fusobacterium sp. TaxID=159267 RepID=UPI0025971CFB|nr:TonB-dependent receptor [uncultured Fusobacterium sp.]